MKEFKVKTTFLFEVGTRTWVYYRLRGRRIDDWTMTQDTSYMDYTVYRDSN